MGRCLRPGGHVGADGSRARARTHKPFPRSNRLPSGQPTASLVRLLLAERRHSQDILLLLLPLVEPATALPCPPSGRDNVLDVYRAWPPHRISMARAVAACRAAAIGRCRDCKIVNSRPMNQGCGPPGAVKVRVSHRRALGSAGDSLACGTALAARAVGLGGCRLLSSVRLGRRGYVVMKLGDRLGEDHALG